MFLMQACGLVHIQKHTVNIHPSAAEHVQHFSTIAKTEINDLEIHLSKKISSLVIGLCVKETKINKHFWYTEVISTPKIYLNAHYWNNSIHIDKEEIVFHELGHCLLNLGHSEGIMNPYHLGKTHYRLNRTRLIKDLLTKAPDDFSSAGASALREKYLPPTKDYEYQEAMEGMTVELPELDWMLK